jgi:hypothetical protein
VSPKSQHASIKAAAASACKYLQQVCKHWDDNLADTFDAAKDTVTFLSRCKRTCMGR